MGNHKFNPNARESLNVTARSTQLLDAFGREIGLGDMVIAPAAPCPVMRVVSVRPDLRPDAAGPPHVIVTVQMTQQMRLPAGVPQAVFLQVLEAPPAPEPVAPPDGPVVKLTDGDGPAVEPPGPPVVPPAPPTLDT